MLSGLKWVLILLASFGDFILLVAAFALDDYDAVSNITLDMKIGAV